MIQIRQRALRAAALSGLLLATVAGMMTAPAAGAASVAPGRHAAPAAPADLILPLTPAPPISPGEPGFVEQRHKCEDIGQAGTAVAVHCVDLFTHALGGTQGTDVYVQNEVFCQRTAPPRAGSTIACSGINQRLGVGSPQGTAGLKGQPCGAPFHHSPCPAGRDLHAGFAFTYVPGGQAILCAAWAESLQADVVLPVTGHPEVRANFMATTHWSSFSTLSARGYCLDT